MKKIIVVFVAVFASFGLFAYNPPAGGQNSLRLTSPQRIFGANSAAGGGIFDVTPSSIVENPALLAWEQRIVLDVAGTLLVSSNGDDDHSVGGAFELGFIAPSRWCVSSFLVQGIWSELYDMPVGNSMNISGSVSKDITDSVSVGVAGNLGFLFGDYGSDLTAGLGIGCFYEYGTLFFMRNLRFGVSMSNIGKMYADSDTIGISTYKDDVPDKADDWPAICTLRTGVAATVVSTDIMEMGVSLDFSYPSFQNFVVDTGLQLQFWDFLRVSAAWEFDAREFASGAKNVMPSVGASFKFILNSKEGSYLAKNGWEQSEITVSGAWKQMYKNVNAVSAGAVLNLGMADVQPPEIILWGEK